MLLSTRLSKALVALACCWALVGCEDSDVRLGRASLDAGEYDKALNIFAMAAQRNPRDAKIRSLIAVTLARKGNPLEADSMMQQAQQLGLSKDEAGMTMYEEAKRALSKNRNQALNLYRAANDLSPALAKSIAQDLGNEANNLMASLPYVALSLYQTAIKYDSNIAPVIAKKILDNANAKLETEKLTTFSLELYKVAVQYDPKLSIAAADKISHAAISNIESDVNTAVALVQAAVEFNSGLKVSLAEVLSQATLAALKQDNIERAITLAEPAANFDANIRRRIISAAFDRAKELISDPAGWEKIVKLARLAKTIGATRDQPWGDMLYAIVAGNEKLTAFDKVYVGGLAVDFDDSKRTAFSTLYVQHGKTEIAQKPPRLDFAETLFKAAVKFDTGAKNTISSFIWPEFERWLFMPVELGRERFKQFFILSRELGMPPQYDHLDTLAMALRKQLEGRRGEAIVLFSQLAKSRADSKEGQFAAAILAAPRPGIRKYSDLPIRKLDGKTAMMDIRLTAAEVTRNDIVLLFNIKTSPAAQGGQRMPSYYSLQPGNSSGDANHPFEFRHGITPQSGSCEQLYLLDDTGKKIYSSTGLIGGDQTRLDNYNCKKIITLNIGKQTNLSIRFPMISPGATTITFDMPEVLLYNAGYNGYAKWPNIRLKNDPFDPPLVVESNALPQRINVPESTTATSPVESIVPPKRIDAPRTPTATSPQARPAAPRSNAQTRQPETAQEKCFMFNGRQVCE